MSLKQALSLNVIEGGVGHKSIRFCFFFWNICVLIWHVMLPGGNMFSHRKGSLMARDATWRGQAF